MCKKLKKRCGGLIYLIFMLVLGFAVNSSFGELLAYYPMNEGSGTVIADVSGYGHDGESQVEPEWVEGPDGFGMALNFGTITSSWVNCGTWNPSEDTGQLTVTLWLKWAGLSGSWQGVVAKRDGWSTAEQGPLMWYIEMNMDTGAIFFARMGQVAMDVNAPPIDQWLHLAVSFDGTTATMYVDGEDANSGEFSFGPGLDSTVMIGADNLGGANPFNGTIDEVRIYNTALTQEEIQAVMWEAKFINETALSPHPKDKEIDVLRDAVLSWKPGGYAVTHNVYFGTDPNDVNDATLDDPRGVLVSPSQAETTYQFADLLDYDTTYYWRIDDVNDIEPNSPWKGKVWSFKTVNYIVMDDFEDYNDYPPNEIFTTWVDGWDDPTNGSVAGHPAPDFVSGKHYLEDEFIHEGNFSFPLYYDNSAGLSWATNTLTADKDWTIDDVITLTIFFHGDAENEAVPMYVALDDYAIVTHPELKAVKIAEWTRWDILLQDFADMGVNLANVNSITLGFGDKANPVAGGEGRVFFDDIRLCRTQPEQYIPRPDSVDPGTANLMAYYDFENDVQDNSGRGRHGTAFNNPGYTTGAAGFGSALTLNGNNHYVSLPIGSTIASMDDATITCWVDFSNVGGSYQRLWDFGVAPPDEDTDPSVYMFITPRSGGTGPMQFGITTGGNDTQSNIFGPVALPSGWHHVAVSIDSSTMTVRMYQDGKLVAEGETSFLPSDLGTTDQNYIGKSQWTADAYYNGALDELRIYNRVLSEAEILYIMGW